jgi:large subunit ribosomal protein L21
MFAIIKTGGKQYNVRAGQVLTIEKIPEKTGGVVFRDVLLVHDATTTIGTPTVPQAEVHAEVLGGVKGKKLTVIKYKAKVRYRRKRGHRQQYSRVKITKIVV